MCSRAVQAAVRLVVLIAFVAAFVVSAEATGCSSLVRDGCQTGIPLGWRIFCSSAHGFSMAYPPGLALVTPGDARVAPGAIVTFSPISDPSIDATGARTNLIEWSVTVAVAGSSQRTGLSRSAGPTICFERTQSCEGAAGNRYETIVYSTVVHGISYSVALFIHSGNPDCYSPGATVPFDRDGLLAILEQMVGTLCVWPSGTRGGVVFRSGSPDAGTAR